MMSFRRTSLVTLLASAGLALASCSGGDKAEGPLDGDAIAKVAAPQGKKWEEIVTVTPEGGYRIGNPDAKLKLVEYASLTCPHCAEFAKEGAAPLREKYVNSGVVSYELRNQIHDGLDLTLNMLVRCGAPESYHPLSEQVWANFEDIYKKVQANGALVDAAMKTEDQSKRYVAIADATGLAEFFAARGISREQINQCLAKPGVAEEIVNRSDKQSQELNINGTPTFILNGQQLDPKSWDELEPILQKAGAR